MAAILRQSSNLITRSLGLFRRGQCVSASRFFNTNGAMEDTVGMEDTVAHARTVETDENVYVYVDMPGCGKEGVNAAISVEQFERKSLCIKGCLMDREINDVNNRNYRCNIDLPDYIHTTDVKAELVNGLLKVTFPIVNEEEEGKKWFEEINVK